MSVIPKSQMTEEDIKLQYITPAILSKWNSWNVKIETQITDGKINLHGNATRWGQLKKVDYMLYINANNPIAVWAKDNKHTISYGLQQGMEYAKMLVLPFTYSSNGGGFMEHDFLTGKERQLLKVLVAPEDGICSSELVPFSVYGDIFAEFTVLYLKLPAVDSYINSITYSIKML